MDKNNNQCLEPIKVLKTNKYYARLLQRDYAGENGELTAIHQYLFQAFMLYQKDSELANTLLRIAKNEMEHLAFLGKLITALGEKPIYCTNINNQNFYWNTTLINYSDNILNMLVNNIKEEKIAIQNYRHHLLLIDDLAVKKIIKCIIADEQEHLQCLENLYRKYAKI